MCLFGKSNILVYTTTSDVVSTLQLQDTIEGIGCIARESLIGTGTDFMFIDSTGVRSLNRTIQEKSVPIGDISMNVRAEYQNALKAETVDNIKSVFHVEDSFYVCFLPTSNQAYVFDTWSPLPTGAARVTKWNQRLPICGVRTQDRTTFFGGTGGVYEYSGAQDIYLNPESTPIYEVTTASIRMSYFTHPLDFGSSANLIFPKQVDVTLFGGYSGALTLNWAYDYKENFAQKTLPLRQLSSPGYWGTDAEWGDTGNSIEWTSIQNNLNQLKYNIWGSGRNITVGFNTEILGSDVSIQEINVQVLQGRLL